MAIGQLSYQPMTGSDVARIIAASMDDSARIQAIQQQAALEQAKNVRMDIAAMIKARRDSENDAREQQLLDSKLAYDQARIEALQNGGFGGQQLLDSKLAVNDARIRAYNRSGEGSDPSGVDSYLDGIIGGESGSPATDAGNGFEGALPESGGAQVLDTSADLFGAGEIGGGGFSAGAGLGAGDPYQTALGDKLAPPSSMNPASGVRLGTDAKPSDMVGQVNVPQMPPWMAKQIKALPPKDRAMALRAWVTKSASEAFKTDKPERPIFHTMPDGSIGQWDEKTQSFITPKGVPEKPVKKIAGTLTERKAILDARSAVEKAARLVTESAGKPKRFWNDSDEELRANLAEKLSKYEMAAESAGIAPDPEVLKLEELAMKKHEEKPASVGDKVYKDESEALAAGHKAGDIIMVVNPKTGKPARARLE